MNLLNRMLPLICGWESHIKSLTSLVLLLLFVVLAYAEYVSKPRLPLINDYPGDWTRKRAKQAFVTNTSELLENGAQKHSDQPFRLIATLGEKIIVPFSWFDWLKKHPDMNHLGSVEKDFFGSWPGFEGMTAFSGDPDLFLVNLVKDKMVKITSALLETFASGADIFLREHFGDRDDFHGVSWHEVCVQMVASTTCTTFAGTRFARNPEWLQIVSTYPLNIVNASRALRSWPAFLRPIAVWILKECRVCRSQVARARQIVANCSLDDNEFDNTALKWSRASKNIDPATIQMGLMFGAVHTTSQLLDQCILDLALASGSKRYPSLISDLRAEIDNVFAETDGKMLPTTLPRLTLLDACIKETQRLKPQTLVNLERVATKHIKCPNGIVIPKGSQVAVSTTPMQSQLLWGPDADMWNPYRFLEVENSRIKATSTDNRHYAFGSGPFACPGRFFAIAEIKVVLAKILKGWDLKLTSNGAIDSISKTILAKERVPYAPFGLEQSCNEHFSIAVRKRS